MHQGFCLRDMPLQLPCRLCADLADRLVGSLTFESALQSIRTFFHQATSEDILILLHRQAHWETVAGRAKPDAPVRDWRKLLQKPADISQVVTDGSGSTSATALWIADEDPVVVVLESDWSHAEETLETCAKIIQLVIRRIRAEQRGRRAQRMMKSALKLTRKTAATRDQHFLARNIVDRVATMFNAERVSIALFSREDQALRIVAACGLPDEIVSRVRIRPGEWALGHAFATSTVVAIADARSLPSRSPNRARYKTHSFAAIPLTFGDETIGVMCITDRRDGEAFAASERGTLRVIGMMAGAALAAAGARESIKTLEHKASIDSVTGLFNRGYLDTRLLEEVERSQREHTQLAVLIADIDNFKAINDNFGHQTGDAVLQQVGEIIRSTVRMFDVCARFGGDEFAILMPNSDSASAFACADRIRKTAAQYTHPHNPSFPKLTVSVGVAVSSAEDGATGVVARADRALYEAKAAGKNAVRGTRDPRARLGGEEIGLPALETAPGGSALRLPYMLVADSAAERRSVYTDAARRHRLGLLIARDAPEAWRLVHQFGAPILLAADLEAPEMQYLALTIAQTEHHAQVVAFSSTRAVRQFFRAAPDASRIHVVSRGAPAGVVEAVLSRVLPGQAEVAAERSAVEDPWRARAKELTDEAARFGDAAGSAVYWKDPASGKMRAVIKWTAQSSMNRCQYFLPRAIEQVLTRGEAVALGDVGSPGSHDRASQRLPGGEALIAAPAKHEDNVVAAVAIFDDAALWLSEDSRRGFEEMAARAVDSIADGPSATPATPAERQPDLDAAGVAAEAAGPRRRRAPFADAPPTLLERQRGEFEVARELARSRREQHQMSVVLFDISKRLRQQQRELPAGTTSETVLQNVVETFVRAVRQSDLPIRWSGNELLLVLPGVAGVEARAVAERVRAAMEAGGERLLSVSGGVAEVERDEQLGTVVERARAKVAAALERGDGQVS